MEIKTPFEYFFGYKSVLDHLLIVGFKAFVLTPPEKQRCLDDCATEACAVGYVNGGKG